MATLPCEISSIMFACTGSEANDLAVRVAERYTGGTGVIVTDEAYHGNSALISGMSPSLGTSVALGANIRTVPPPDSYRLDANTLGRWFAAGVAAGIADLERHGHRFSALLAVGNTLRSELSAIAEGSPFLGDVRGAGLYVAVEIVADRHTKTPDGARAQRLVDAMRDRHVLISVCGPHGSVLKVRPPLVFSSSDADWFLTVFGEVVEELE
jgi:4-aminobutyrate aminotransferase-like enzyme